MRALRERSAADDVMRCVLDDPRVDRQIESRGRYLGELVAAHRLPIDPIVASLRDLEEDALGHEVLAAAAAFGHGAPRALLEDDDLEPALRAHVALWLVEWEVLQPVALPGEVRTRVLAEMFEDVDSTSVARGLRQQPDHDLGKLSVHELLELTRSARVSLCNLVDEELVRRDREQDRAQLLQCLQSDPVLGRARTAARVLGALQDDRALPLCEDLFGREDVFEDPERRLSAMDRTRRTALSRYVLRLPGPRQLELARRWHPRGGYFAIVAGNSFAAHAEPDDRTYLERFVEQDLATGTGWNVISEVDALARLADPRSAPLLCSAVERVAYSHARRRAVHALAMIASDSGQEFPALHEALWDSEDEAAADACAFAPTIDEHGWLRVEQLARAPAFEHELRQRAVRRLRRR